MRSAWPSSRLSGSQLAKTELSTAATIAPKVVVSRLSAWQTERRLAGTSEKKRSYAGMEIRISAMTW